MELILSLAFIFFIGSVTGWVLEVLFRHFIASGNPERKWINPGFCTGPYLPLYGFGLCLMYLISELEEFSLTENVLLEKATLLLFIAISMTVIEYIAGILSLKLTNVRLWDYTNEWGNIQGIICPKYSLIWALLGAVYYFLIHPTVLRAVEWLTQNLAFSFVIGMFFGVLLLDVAHSIELITKLKGFAEEYNVVVKYEALKAYIHKQHKQAKKKYRYFLPFRSERPLYEYLKELADSFEERIKKNK